MKYLIFFLFTLLLNFSICDKTGLTNIPSFLKIIPSNKRTEVEGIVLNQTLSQNEMYQKLDNWANTLGQAFNSLYKSYKKAFLEAKKELKEKHNLMLQSETDEDFKKVDAQIQSIADNYDMPIGEVRYEILQIINNQTDAIKEKLKEKSPY
uniref:DUF148 domain-containing protein n=1 Tax=Strongyloides venezuelensis TaxID=75913 RepID=A0A0K0F7U4_STRVS